MRDRDAVDDIGHNFKILFNIMSYEEYEESMIARYKEAEIQPIIIEHAEYIQSIIKNQKVLYMDALLQLKDTQSISQLRLCVEYLKYGLKTSFIEQLCSINSILNKSRESLYCSILAINMNEETSYLYGPTIRLIFKILEFYDIIIRSLRDFPPYYHRYRYERFIEYCIQFPELVLVPTFYNIGATDLLKLRPYPIYPIGISTTILHVDEYLQTPSEFFVHDINHIRRMHENNISDMKRRGITDSISYYDQSKLCLDKIMTIMNNKIKKGPVITIPQIKDKGIIEKEAFHMNTTKSIDYDTPIDAGYSQIIKIIVFEIIHEDALVMQEDVICSTILRNSGFKTIFPTIGTNGIVKNSIVSGGSILGFVRYKLRYGFLDTVTSVNENIVKMFYRTDKQIFNATRILLTKLCGVTIDEKTTDRIILNIIDNSGLNKPEHPDILEVLMPTIITDEEYGDYTQKERDSIRTKYSLPLDYEFTGIRPQSIVEQRSMFGGSKRKLKRIKKSRRIYKVQL